MRNVIFYDQTIPEKKLIEVLIEYKNFLRDTSGAIFTYDLIPYDFSDYPTYLDADNDERPTPAFLKSLSDRVTKEYGQFGTDNIKLLIHQDNWKSDPPGAAGIWGTNYSYVYGTFHLQYCRWDKKNPANSFGTINHEDDHTYDALVKVELGININPILGTKYYDAETTHGDRDNGGKNALHGYIRYQENADKLRTLSPYIKAAYAKRLERHKATTMGQLTSAQKTVIPLLEKLAYQLRMRLNKKDGVSIN